MAVKNKPIAFIYINGDVWTGEAHWRIIEKIFMGDIAEFLYAIHEVPSTWGWIWLTGKKLGDKAEAILELYTEIGPHLTTIDDLGPVVDAVQDQLGVAVIDIETPDPPERPVLERYTPEGIDTTVKDPKDYGTWGGESDKKPVNTPLTTDTPTNSVKFLKREEIRGTSVGDVVVSTTDERAFNNGYVVRVYEPGNMNRSYGEWTEETSDTALHRHQQAVSNIEEIVQAKTETSIDSWSEDDSHELMNNHMQELADQIEDPTWSGPTKYMHRIAKSGPYPNGEYTDNELMMADAPGFSIAHIDPPEGTHHEDGERPFIYYAPTETLFETTRPCHHHDVLHKIYNIVTEMSGGRPNIYDPSAWTWGDITDPEQTGRNWIKFISGPITRNVTYYFLDKYPGRDVMHSGDDGWEPVDPSRIAKIAFTADPEHWKTLPGGGSFGYVNGHLIRGDAHHQVIMAGLLEAGWTWEQLMSVPQAWGWFAIDNAWGAGDTSPYVDVKFASDAGFQTVSDDEVLGAFAREYKLPAKNRFGEGSQRGITYEVDYGLGLGGGGKEMIKQYQENSDIYIDSHIADPIPPPPTPEEEEKWTSMQSV